MIFQYGNFHINIDYKVFALFIYPILNNFLKNCDLVKSNNVGELVSNTVKTITKKKE